jgi:hypothetical protein
MLGRDNFSQFRGQCPNEDGVQIKTVRVWAEYQTGSTDLHDGIPIRPSWVASDDFSLSVY